MHRATAGDLRANINSKVTKKQKKCSVVVTMQTDLRSEKSEDWSIENDSSIEIVTNDAFEDRTEDMITCTELYSEMERTEKCRLIIIDTRSKDDFLKSRIKSERCINIPAEFVTPDMTANKMITLVNGDAKSKAIYRNRGKICTDLIVLMDWCTRKSRLTRENRMSVMKQIFLKRDPGVNYKRILMLEGGYDEWLDRFPHDTTDPYVMRPRIGEATLTSEVVEDVEYILSPEDDDAFLAKRSTVDLVSTSFENPEDRCENQSLDESKTDSVDQSESKTEINEFESKTESEYQNRSPDNCEGQNRSVGRLEKENRASKRKQSVRSDKKHKNPLVLAEKRDKFVDRSETPKKCIGLSENEIVDGLEEQSDFCDKSETPDDRCETPDRSTSEINNNSDHFTCRSLLDDIERSNPIYADGSNVQATKSPTKSPRKSPTKSQMKLRNTMKRRTEPREGTPTKPARLSSVAAFVEDESSEDDDYLIDKQVSKNVRDQRTSPRRRNKDFGVTGLRNLGNSCYMNSIVQCLSNTSEFAKYFIDDLWYNALDVSRLKNERQKHLVKEIANLMKALWCGRYESVSPHNLKALIGKSIKQFANNTQQDCHEFFTLLLAQIRQELGWDNKRCIISQLFFGQLRSSVHCTICGHRSATDDNFSSLTLPLPDAPRCTLDYCLKKYVSEERISDWRCPKCRTTTIGCQEFRFVKLPPVIVVHLNRFGKKGRSFSKKNTNVKFPLNSFDLSRHVACDSETVGRPMNSYDLYAVSNHHGTMNAGHYTAYCKNATTNRWYEFNDQTVTEVSTTDVESDNSSAYLLFYHASSSPEF